jgi:hypothetical protein
VVAIANWCRRALRTTSWRGLDAIPGSDREDAATTRRNREAGAATEEKRGRGKGTLTPVSADEELGEAINNPANGDRVKVRGNRVLQGNTRINEAKSRDWPDDTKIPVDELPELPDNIDEEPLGPYGDL